MNTSFTIIYACLAVVGAAGMVYFPVTFVRSARSRTYLYSGLSVSAASLTLFLFGSLDPYFTYPPVLMAAWTSVFWACTAIAIGCSAHEMSLADLEGHRNHKIFAGVKLAVAIGLLLASAFVAGQSATLHMPTPSQVDIAASDQEEGKAYQFENFNLSYVLPVGPWVEFNVKQWSKDSLIAFFKTNPNVYFQIIAEQGFTTQQDMDEVFAQQIYGEINKENDNKVLDKKHITIADITGYRFDSNMTLKNGQRIRRLHWFGGKNGFYYQFIAWTGMDVPMETLEKEFGELTKGIALMDAEKKVPPRTIKEDHVSKKYHYAVHSKDKGWDSWWLPETESMKGVSLCDYKIFKGNNEMFLVYPLVFKDEAPPLSVLTEALVQFNVIDFSQVPAANIRPIKENDYEGNEIDYEHEQDGVKLAFRVKILRSSHFVYYVSAYNSSKFNAATVSDLTEARKMFEALKPGRLPDTKDFTQEEKKRHGMAYYWIGKVYMKMGDKKNSLAYLKNAYEITTDKDDLLSSLNILMDAYMDLELYKEGYAYIEKHRASFKDETGMRKKFAELAALASHQPEAKQMLEQLIKEGHGDAETLEGYLTLMKDMGKEKEAYQSLKGLAETKGTSDPLFVLADVLEEHQKLKESLEIRKALYEKTPRDEEVRKSYFFLLMKQERYAEAAEQMKSHIDKYGGSADVYFYQGYVLTALKRYGEAREAFEKAKALVPDSDLIQNLIDGLKDIEKQTKGDKPDYELNIIRDISLEERNLLVHERLVYSGYSPSYVNSYMTGNDYDRKKTDYKSFLTVFYGKTELDKFEVDAPEDSVIIMNVTYRIFNATQKIGDRLMVQLPRGSEKHYLWPNSASQYAVPLSIIRALKMTSITSLVFPEGYKPELGQSETQNSAVSDGCLKYEAKVDKKPQQLKFENSYTVRGGSYTLKQTDQCQESITESLDQSLPQILLSPNASG